MRGNFIVVHFDSTYLTLVNVRQFEQASSDGGLRECPLVRACPTILERLERFRVRISQYGKITKTTKTEPMNRIFSQSL
jgi:hypothetical protein